MKSLALLPFPWLSVLAGVLLVLSGIALHMLWSRFQGSRPAGSSRDLDASKSDSRAAAPETTSLDDGFAREVIASAPIVVILLERDTMIPHYVSPYAEVVLGYSPRELLELGAAIFGKVIDPQSKAPWTAHFESLDEQPDERIAEVLLEATHRDGRRRWLLSRDRVFRRGPEGRADQVLCMAMDVTLLMETRQKIVRSRNEAQAANRAKDEFLALISHELNTPLNAVFGGAQLLLSEAVNEEQQEFCEIILEGARGLKVLFHDLLELTQTQADRVSEFEERIVTADALTALGSRFGDLVQAAGLSWSLDLGSGLPDELLGDWVRVESILSHLIDNAIKFTSEGRISLSVRELARDGNTLWTEWSLCDTGIGIEESLRERVFEPFSQAEEPHARRYGGPGIGLTIVRRQVELLNGTVDVTSVPGSGSCFYLKLPFRISAN